MVINTSRFKEYLLKSRIDLLEKINEKPYFILYDDWQTDGQSKLHTGCSEQWKKNFVTVIPKQFENRTLNTKDMGKYEKYKNSQKPTKNQLV